MLRAQETDRNGNLISYSYNSDNNLIGKVALGVQEYEKYLYNRDGSLLATINNNSVETYTYTPNGYIKSEARNDKTILEYRIDKNGRVTRVTDAEGDYTGYTFDTVGRIKSVSEGSASKGSDITATYSYNADSTIASIDYTSGIKAAYGYDSDKNISYQINKKPDGSILEYYDYTYDNNGNQLAKTENGITTTYAYDKLNRLTKENDTTYTYDNAGNRLTKTDKSASISYAYDQKNRLTRETAGGIITTYSYDNNGNLTEKSDGTGYDYNAFNQLLESSNADGSWQLNIYDATGLRMAMVENGSYTQLTYDRGNLIADYDKDENKKTRYIRGYDLLSQQNDDGTRSYYLHNGHGDVTKLVDGNGSVLNSYNYDAFGNTVSYTEKVENRFRYSGEQQDMVTGAYYLRARYYEPQVGRFTQEDAYKGNVNDPLSLNLYTYCMNNPIIYIDPSGYKAMYLDGGGNSTKCGSGSTVAKTGNAKTVQESSFDFNPDGTIAVWGGMFVGEQVAKVAVSSPHVAATIVLTVVFTLLWPAKEVNVGEDEALAERKKTEEAGNTEFPDTPEEMDELLGQEGKKIPDGPSTQGRDKVKWKLPDGTEITYEQHPYDVGAPDFHAEPHYHVDIPGDKPHITFRPGDQVPFMK